MDTPDLTSKTDDDAVVPDVSDFSEFHGADGCCLFIIYIMKEGHPVINTLILRPANAPPGSAPKQCCYKRIGYYRQYWYGSSGRDATSVFLDRFVDDEICFV
jgi:hypothetical protein